MDRSEKFEIRLEEQLAPDWAEDMNAMSLRHADGGTVLSGWVRDQAELHGILGKVRDLGLSIVYVQRIDSRERR